ncbi:MAG: hypothetical protein JSW51_14490 [Gemmatimonadota bacterium]|nr:MAG: hypothetical protein JSW51_14490 [Gemmatimonadota bacterium]
MRHTLTPALTKGALAALCLMITAVPAVAQQTVPSGGLTEYVAVGRDGTVLYSRDEGANWTLVTPIDSYINGVVSDNRGRFVAVGARGKILLSRDGGASWETIASGTEETLQAIASDDDGRFVAVGANGTIVISHDGADTWNVVSSGTTDALLSVATDHDGTWVLGGAQGLMARSRDGGVSWTITNSNMAAHVNDVTFVGEDRWVAVGLLGKTAYSTDGGQTWTESSAPTRQTLEGVASDGSSVVAVGWKGTAARSEDGGETWTVGETGTTQRLMALTLGRDGAFVAAGWRGTVAVSNDGGTSWAVQENLSRKVLEQVAYNRLPDFAVSNPRLDSSCQVVVDIVNRGPADLPAEVWDSESVTLRMSSNDEPVDSVSITALDPDRELRTPTGHRQHTFASRLTAADTLAVAVAIDANRVVAEAREANNMTQAILVCGN